MFGLGIPELMVIFVIALLVFGPKKLPELGKSIGRAMAEFKKAQQEFQNSVQAEMREVEKNVEMDKIKELGRVDASAFNPPGMKVAEEPQDSQAHPTAASTAPAAAGTGPEPQKTAEAQQEPAKSEEAKGNG